MKNILFIGIFGLIMCLQKGFAQDLDFIRANYLETPTNEALWEKLTEELNKEELTNLEMAYSGALQMIGAKYTGNPFSKLSVFKKGKEKVEQAIKNEPNNAELRYLRLSMQVNAPRFLGYHKEIEMDKIFLRENLDKVNSEDLRKRIEKILEE